ncbi:MAG: biotin synthase BioB, partial [Candidatus Lindowbacteria bacterium RIFCSPLOWO2_02_FULL_62_12]
RNIKSDFPDLEICCSLGLMRESQARRLKDAGAGWINHNLNTSERFYSSVCTTHTYQDRIETVQAVKAAGMHTCSGGIIGMGETERDVLDLAFTIQSLDIDSIPVNFLHPIRGTPLGDQPSTRLEMGLRTLSLFRFLNPRKDIRAAGGREFNFGADSYRVLYAANSIFVEGYLTTSGQTAEDAHRMIESHGFEIEH